MSGGKFITLEGGEGVGKSTQARLLLDRIKESGHAAIMTREPGGSELAEAVREFVLSGEAKEFGPFAEAVLFTIAREDHLEQTIRPALERGYWVVCDRFIDSTRAYQGTAGVPPGVIKALDRLIVHDTRPDLTIVLDLPPEEGLARAARRSGGNGHGDPQDPFESRELGYHLALRDAFLNIARNEPERVVVVDASRHEVEVAEDVWDAVAERLKP